ncbi:MAG TPA: ABC transporter permease [Terriglobia bacterium]|nr:ABC transporter permease [Terriglobia bacterium]
MVGKFLFRLRALFRRKSMQGALDEEVRSHLRMAAQERIARGESAEQARVSAVREFGNVGLVKEVTRDMWGWRWLETLLQDVRYGARQLCRNPGFSAVAILTLALGIGANAAIFSMVDGILLRPLPYAGPDRLVSVWQTGVPKGICPATREASRAMEVGAYSWNSGINLVRHGEALQVIRSEVSVNLFQVLGVSAALGRTFETGDDAPGKDKLVILSHALWQNRFGSDPHILGQWITLDDLPRLIIGVMPASFTFPSAATQVWIPIELSPETLWGNFIYTMVGRLRPGATTSEARAEFKTLVPRVVKLMPWHMPPDWGSGADVLPLQDYTVGDVKTKLMILWAAVGLVLLMACVNVANLLLSRATGRRREMSLRAALGAGRWRVTQQLLTESVLLAVLGGGLGLALALEGVALLKAFLPQDTPRLAATSINWHVLGFTVLVSISAGIVFGLAPALSSSRMDLEQEIRSASVRTGAGRGHRRLSSMLVVAEVALEVVVVLGALLLVRSLWVLTQREPGFQPTRLLTAHVNQISSHCKASDNCVRFYDELFERVSALPGVRAAGVATGIPGSGVWPTALSVEGYPLSIDGTKPLEAWGISISPDYLRAQGVPLLRGRDFTEADRAGSQGVVLTSALAARKWWPGQDPIGKRIKLAWVNNWRTVVGVVGDARESGLADPPLWAADVTGTVYFPYAQGVMGPGLPADMTLVVQTQANPAAIAGALRAAVASVDAGVPLTDVQTMDQVLSNSIAGPRSTTWLFLSFGILALLLGTIGVYGVVSYSVASRVGEFGIRMALGATKHGVLKMVLNEGLKLTAGGLVVGLASALALSRFMSHLLFGVRPHDWVAFICTPAITAIVAVAASYVPARRATKVDPMVALRYE